MTAFSLDLISCSFPSGRGSPVPRRVDRANGLSRWRYWFVAWVCVLVSALGLTAAQAADFTRTYGTAGTATAVQASAMDAAGNAYVAGHFNGATVGMDATTLTRIGIQDAFVAKLDPSGVVLWAKNFGGSSAQVSVGALAVDGDGNVYVGGDFNGAVLTSPALSKLGVQDAFVLKLDSSGSIAWAKNFGGGSATVTGSGIAVDGVGNVYLGGDFQGADLSTPTLTLLGTRAAFAIKLVALSGDAVWWQRFGGPGATVSGTGIAVDAAGTNVNVYLGGDFAGAALTTPALGMLGIQDGFALKLNSSGDTVWAKNFGGVGASVSGAGIAVDAAGSVYLGGDFGGDLTMPALSAIGPRTGFAIKLGGLNGSTTWARNIGGPGATLHVSGVAGQRDGRFFLSGDFAGANLTSPGVAKLGVPAVNNGFVASFTDSGVDLWMRIFLFGVDPTIGTDVAVDNAGNFLLSGYIDFATPATLTGFTIRQSPIKVETKAATGIALGNATLNGTVIVNNVPVIGIAFDYGASLAYGQTQAGEPASLPASSGSTVVSVTGALAGLACNTVHFFRISATYAGGTVKGRDLTFTTAACTGGPNVTTNAASLIAQSSATLNGTVADVGVNVTAITFEYGLTTSYGLGGSANITTIAAFPGGPIPVAVTRAVTGLTCGTTYHYRVSATDANGTNHGSDQTFTTVACLAGSLTPNPASLDFGGESMTTTSPVQAVTFTNTTGSVVTVNAVTVSTHYAVEHDCATLAVGATCTANVTFTPGAEIPGTDVPMAGTLTITSSLGPQTVALTGIGERSLVTHYYRSILRRAPEPKGKADWEAVRVMLQSWGANINETWYAIATSFLFSAEYRSFNRDNTGFVIDLYRAFLNREPEAQGLADWTGLLAQGMPREIVVTSFMFSAEFGAFTQNLFGNTAARKEIDTVMDFYRGLLSRVPEKEGFDFWLKKFRTAQCAGGPAVVAAADQISSGFTTSPEYLALARTNGQYVGDLYNAFLRRGGEPDGVQYWLNQLASGVSRESLRRQFLTTPEFRARVNAVIAEGCLP